MIVRLIDKTTGNIFCYPNTNVTDVLTDSDLDSISIIYKKEQTFFEKIFHKSEYLRDLLDKNKYEIVSVQMNYTR